MNRIGCSSLSTRRGLSMVALLTGFGWTFCASNALAGIQGISGDGELIAPPASVDAGALESNSHIRIFEEKRSFVLPTDVAVDILGVGRADMDNRNNPPTPGVIQAGTRVDVFFIHHDSVAETLNTLTTQISTDTEILGMIHSDNLLDASDALLGDPNTVYPTGLELRGMVVDPTEGDNEVAQVNNTPLGPRLVTTISEVEHVLDQARVITIAAIPEPSTALLCLSSAAVGLACAGRREQRPTRRHT